MYFYCAFGGTARLSQNCESPDNAARYCFGLVDRVTVLPIGTKAWKFRPEKERATLFSQLKALHKERTGNDL